jgi:hypothetical protein
MDEILSSLGSTGWWFSTVVVAIIANVGANYLYDFLKPRMVGRWPAALLLSIVAAHCVLFALSILTFDFSLKYALSLFMLIATPLVVYDGYIIPGSGLSLIMSVLAVFSITMFDPQLPRALKQHDHIWFGQQYALASLMASMIYIIAWTILWRRQVRRRRKL